MSYSQSNRNMEDLLWLVDSWINIGGETVSYEHWKKADDSLLEGSSETIKNGNTVFSEKLKIVKEKEGIYYVAEVKHNPLPVYFKLTMVSKNKAVFENPQHDFPQKITYEIEQGTLHAFIEGPGRSGKWEKVDFYFDKMR